MNEQFARAVRAGVKAGTRIMGEPFEIDGIEYHGVFASASVDVAMATGGFQSLAHYVLKCDRDQFAERVAPADRSFLTWRGEEWIVMQDMQPNHPFTVALVVARRSAG